jgi:aspartokinase
MRTNLLPRFRFIAGFVVATLIFGVGAVAVNVNNTPEGGYLLCANKKTRAVTFPGTLKCPSGTVEIQVPGSNSDFSSIEDNSEDTNTNNSNQTSVDNNKGIANCNLNYLQNNPSQVSAIVSQCSSGQLSKLQVELSAFDQASSAKLAIEQSKLQSLQKEADSKKGTAGAQAAADAVNKQAALVADYAAKMKSNILILTAIVQAIAKKVKG